jgi:hypothetical protein
VQLVRDPELSAAAAVAAPAASNAAPAAATAAAANAAATAAAAPACCPLQAMKAIRWLTSEPSVLPDMKNSGAISQLVSRHACAEVVVCMQGWFGYDMPTCRFEHSHKLWIYLCAHNRAVLRPEQDEVLLRLTSPCIMGICTPGTLSPSPTQPHPPPPPSPLSAWQPPAAVLPGALPVS